MVDEIKFNIVGRNFHGSSEGSIIGHTCYQLAIKSMADQSRSVTSLLDRCTNYPPDNWIPVERGPTKIPFELDSTPLEIRTDTTAPADEVHVIFKDSLGKSVGRVIIRRRTPRSGSNYWIKNCRKAAWKFNADSRPPADDKVWRIQLDKSSGIRLMIYCNDVKLVDILMSDSTCNDPNSGWKEMWGKEVKTMVFHSTYDTASKYYRQYRQSGNQLLKMHRFLIEM